ncbi:MAG: acyltransferase family protein [Prochlorococcaceae cyanobacterium]
MAAGFRSDIQGLRALAVVAVIINHFNPKSLAGGFLGVDLFFVISGYVITNSLLRQQAPSLGVLLLEFYSRRIRRLLPALLVFVIPTALAVCLVDPEPARQLTTAAWALVGGSNIELYLRAVDYFGAASELNAFTHTWSLGVEEQFYLLFPLVLWLCGLGRRRKPGAAVAEAAAGGADGAAVRRAFWLLLLLCAASLVAYGITSARHPSAAFFLMPLRFWELGAGALTALALVVPVLGALQHRLAALSRRLPGLPELLLLLLCLSLVVNLRVRGVGLVCLLSCGLLLCCRPGSRAHRWLSLPLLQWIGAASYSLYLWHWGVLALSRWTVGVRAPLVPLQLLLIVALAWLSFTLVETPLRQARWAGRPGPVVARGLALVGAGAGLLLGLAGPGHGALYLGRRDPLEQRTSGDGAAGTGDCNLFQRRQEGLRLAASCGVEQGPGRPTLYLLGDSHMAQFAPALAAQARRHGTNLRAIWASACLFPAALVDTADRDGPRCHQLQSELEAVLLPRLRPGDIVFIGNAYYRHFSERWRRPGFQVPGNEPGRASGQALSSHQASALYGQRLRQVAERMVARGAQVVIYTSGAHFKGLGPAPNLCDAQWFRPRLRPSCFTEQGAFERFNREHLGGLAGWADQRQRFLWSGLAPEVCDGRRCSAHHFDDASHFRRGFTVHLLERFLREHPQLFAAP